MLAFHPATPDRWGDLEQLFGPERGANSGCWCMWFRVPRRAWEELGRDGRKRSFRRVVRAGEVPGILAYQDGRAVGWCAIAPRAATPGLERSRVARPVDGEEVWSVTCFFVDPRARRQGTMQALLEAAVAHAASHGARVVEGYPKEPSTSAGSGDLFVGTAQVFRAAGFREVARPSPTRRIMRRRIR